MGKIGSIERTLKAQEVETLLLRLSSLTLWFLFLLVGESYGREKSFKTMAVNREVCHFCLCLLSPLAPQVNSVNPVRTDYQHIRTYVYHGKRGRRSRKKSLRQKWMW